MGIVVVIVGVIGNANKVVRTILVRLIECELDDLDGFVEPYFSIVVIIISRS